MRRRSAALAAVLTVAAAVACSPPEEKAERRDPPTDLTPAVTRFRRDACSLPAAQLERIRAGFRRGRSGDVQFVPHPPTYFGRHSHSGPWPYLQHVPLLFYGPPHVSAEAVTPPVTLADVAPTMGRLIGFDLRAPDGEPLLERASTGEPPRLVVVVVWDGAGRNVLDEWPGAWPELRRLAEGGAWFEHARVGTSPSVTPTVHATIGTGAFPRRHGVTDLFFRAEGRIVDIRESTRFLLVPTLADRYDAARGNRPVVGMLADYLTTGMVGRGADLPQGDRDVVAVHGEESDWTLEGAVARAFRFPAYVNDVGGLEERVRTLDAADGLLDGSWRGGLDLSKRADWWGTPAYPSYQTDVIAEMVRRERFGADRVPDLLFVNYKLVDKVAHRFSMNSPHMRDAVAASDGALGELVRALDRDVGRGRWVLALTADHGSTPDASVSGAYVINMAEQRADLARVFDGDGDEREAIMAVRVTQLWVDGPELAENGHRVEDVARFLSRYTRGENRADPSEVSEEDRRKRIYAAAFPSALLERLNCP